MGGVQLLLYSKDHCAGPSHMLVFTCVGQSAGCI